MPAYPDSLAKKIAVKLGANLSLARGAVLACITATSANDVQTVTVNGTPTGGTFKLVYNGQTTGTIAYNAAASVVQAALVALSNIGTGNVAVTGSGGGPWTVTFQGALGNYWQPLMTVDYSLLTGGSTPTVTNVHTTPGVLNGSYVAYAASGVLAAPAAPTVTATGSDGLLAVGAYSVAVTYLTAQGETTPGPAATIAVASTNHIHVAQISSVPAGVTGAKYYINGFYAGTTAVSGGNIAATDFLSYSTNAGIAPATNTAFTTFDGSQLPVGLLAIDSTTDNQGRVTYSPSSGLGDEHGQFQASSPVYYKGEFKTADLVGLDAGALAVLGRLLAGTTSVGILSLK